MKHLIQTVFDNTVQSYERFLKDYYPAHGANGFTERNLTFNFSHNYLRQSPNAIIWQEVPLVKCGGKREHFDTLIIDNENKSILIIEAKRLGTDAKYNSVQNDLTRIKEKYKFVKDIEDKIDLGYSLYALLLVDIWIPKDKGGQKENQRNQFLEIEGNGYFSKPINEERLSDKETYQIGFKLLKIR
jgi:hypothetical protein